MALPSQSPEFEHVAAQLILTGSSLMESSSPGPSHLLLQSVLHPVLLGVLKGRLRSSGPHLVTGDTACALGDSLVCYPGSTWCLWQVGRASHFFSVNGQPQEGCLTSRSYRVLNENSPLGTLTLPLEGSPRLCGSQPGSGRSEPPAEAFRRSRGQHKHLCVRLKFHTVI